MTRAYLRLDPNLADTKASYPDGAWRAFVETLCFAEQQPTRGVFRNRKLLAVYLDKRARWIAYLVDQGDLIVMPTGQLVVDGWQEWQEGDWKVSERMQRIRSRERRTVDTVTTDTVATVTNDTVDTVTTDTVATVTGLYSGGKVAVSGKQIAEAKAPRGGGGDPPRSRRRIVRQDGRWQAAD